MTDVTQLHPARAAEIGALVNQVAERIKGEAPAVRAKRFDEIATAHVPPLLCHYCDEATARSVQGACPDCYVGGRHLLTPEEQNAYRAIVAERKASETTAPAEPKAAVTCAFCRRPNQTMIASPSTSVAVCPECVAVMHNALKSAGKLPSVPGAPAEAAPAIAAKPEAPRFQETIDLVHASAEIGKLALETAKKMTGNDDAQEHDLRETARTLADVAETLASAASHVHTITTGGK